MIRFANLKLHSSTVYTTNGAHKITIELVGSNWTSRTTRAVCGSYYLMGRTVGYTHAQTSVTCSRLTEALNS